jgi:cellulose synthase/poly-beta-1,6-N-acetylglucosamine synthase-like glycosyltransferase
MEIACRMQTHHYKIKNCPDAYVYTVTPDTIKKLHRQRVRWIHGFFKNAIDYKHLFFNTKYGNLGVLTFPLSAAFLFTSLYVAAMALKVGVEKIALKYMEIDTVGINLALPSFTFDLFYINTQTLYLLSSLTLLFTITFMLLGKKMAEGTVKPGLDLIYFFCFYGFIAPFWVLKALYNTAFSRKTTWR